MKFYSVKDLVPEITGLTEDDLKLYESAKRDVNRIDELLRGISSYRDTEKIPESNKVEYVNLVRTLHNDRELKAIVSKFSRGEKLTEKEVLAFFDACIESAETEERKSYFEQFREQLKMDELKHEVDEMYLGIKKIVDSTECFVYDVRLEIITHLKIEIGRLISNFENEITMVKEIENIRLHLETIEDEVEREAELDKILNQYPKKRKIKKKK